MNTPRAMVKDITKSCSSRKERMNKGLATMLGKDPATSSKRYINKLQPNWETLKAIAECLDLDINDLLWSTRCFLE